MRILIFILIFSSFDQGIIMDSKLTIEVELLSIRKLYDDEYVLDCVLILYNNSQHDIILPRTFNLDIVIKDSLSTKVNRNREVAHEHHNLINLDRTLKIKSQESLRIPFYEWRLFQYDLNIGEKYYIQYILYANEYKRFRKVLGERILFTNEFEFTYFITE